MCFVTVQAVLTTLYIKGLLGMAILLALGLVVMNSANYNKSQKRTAAGFPYIELFHSFLLHKKDCMSGHDIPKCNQ